MKTGNAGLALIKSFEGLRLKAYLCPAQVWTIGYGHTGPDVKPGLVISEDEATNLLRRDLARFEAAVTAAITMATQSQFDALVSLVYNIGPTAFRKSTLLRKHNARDYAGAAREFDKWNRGGGRILAGLVRRRSAERKLYEAVA